MSENERKALFDQRFKELLTDTPKDLIGDTYAQTLGNIIDRAAAEAAYADIYSKPDVAPVSETHE